MVDADNTKRISELAKNLKEMHLASTVEEAEERAKQIILGTAPQGQDKSINELMIEAGVTQKDLNNAKELLDKEAKALEELKKELDELKAKQSEETKTHEKHAKETEDIDNEIINAEHDVGVVEENIDVAEQIQDEKPENP